MQCLDVSKPRGHNCLSPVLFKRTRPSIYGLFRTIKQTCNFPSFWKIGKVKPLFTKGSQVLVTNYRPITLLCILSKIIKNCIFDSLYSFAAPSLHSSQFGFTKGKSTIVQSICYSDETYIHAQTNDICVEAFYLDFEKAFDKTDRAILIEKLKSIGVYGKLLNILRSYLSDQKQFVEINGYKSSL